MNEKEKFDRAIGEFEAEEESACPMTGTMGIHSESYYDDGRCDWCGAKKKMESE